MPINLNLSPAGRAKGRKKRLNPLPQALSSLPPAPPAKPLEYLETLSPARLVVRAIRNKESNRDIDHMNRLELLTQSTARINADLLSARTQFAARCIPRTDTPYCNPACGSSVGSEGKPMNTASNYHAGNPNPTIAAPHDPQFTLRAGEELNSMLDTFMLDSPMHEYRDKRDSSLVAFRDTRNSHLASLIPLELDTRCRFGGSNIREELAPHAPNPSIQFRNYLRRRKDIHDSQIQNESLIHKLQNAICDKVGTPYQVSGRKASPRIKQALLKDDIRASDHGITGAEFRDLESVIESTGESLGSSVHTLVSQSTARMDASELSDNWLMVSRDLSDRSVKVHSASTMKSAEWKARQVHIAHPNTVNAVVSRAQALSARWDSLFTTFEEKHTSE